MADAARPVREPDRGCLPSVVVDEVGSEVRWEVNLGSDLFNHDSQFLELAPGAMVLRGFAVAGAPALLAGVAAIAQRAPFRHLITPGGFRMSVAMTNCGAVGWVSDRTGYRYDRIDPDTGLEWPPMPSTLRNTAVSAATAAGFDDYFPDVCLINRYAPGARLSLHQDRNELDDKAPIVSVSLGLQAVFLFGGLKGPNAVHACRWNTATSSSGVAPPVCASTVSCRSTKDFSPELGRQRINLTFRTAL